MKAALFLVPGVAALAACGPSASGDTYERTSTSQCLPGFCTPDAAAAPAGDASIGSMPLEQWPDETAGQYSGVYAIHAFVTAHISVITVSFQLLYRLRILQETATDIMQSTDLCAIKLPSVPGIATLNIPPKLDALITEKSDEVLSGTFLTMSGSGEVYAPPPILSLFGAKLNNPATDPLPTPTDLTNEWDEDMDGHPGVTIDALVPLTCPTPQQLYIAIRAGGTLKGTFNDAGGINGSVHVIEGLSILGYSDPCLTAAMELKPTIDPDSTFTATKLATESQLDSMGNVDCADIVAQAPMLYGAQWTGGDAGADGG